MLDHLLYTLCEALPARLHFNVIHLAVALPLLVALAFSYLVSKEVSR